MQKIASGVELIIFDMDGLLIDSEPYWKIAEKKVFGALGIALNDDLLRQVMGFRLREVINYWYEYKPWENPEFEKTEKEILQVVKLLILDNANALPGVFEVLEYFKQNSFKIALASSSHMELIEAVVDKLNIRPYFDKIWSAEFEKYGKPHPSIFLSVADSLNIHPNNCIVFEDSVNGVIAAKAAKMKCIAVPEKATFHDPRFAIADKKLNSLLDFLTLE